MAIQTVLATGRNLFPAADCGYRSWLFHPNAAIRPAGPTRSSSYKNNLVLTSLTPREIKNGRYYPGHDSLESSYWLMNRLREEGISAKAAGLQTTVSETDVAVEADGNLYSLNHATSALLEGRFSKSGCSFVEYIPDYAMQRLWEEKRSVEHPVSGVLMPLNWGHAGSMAYLNSVGIFFRPGNTFDINFSTRLFAEGLPVCEKSISTYIHMSRLAFITEGIRNRNDQQAMEFLRLFAQQEGKESSFPAFSHANTEIKAGISAICGETAEELTPQILRLIDDDWADNAARKTGGFVKTIVSFFIRDITRAFDPNSWK